MVFSEFVGSIESVLGNKNKILKVCNDNQANILITPENFSDNLNSKALEEKFKEYNITADFDNTHFDYVPQSVSFWFSKDGKVYGFLKQWEKEPVHKISEEVGITICGEIRYIKPEDLKGIKILYNPANENDDLYIRGRTLYYTGKPIKEILQFYDWLTYDYKIVVDENQNIKTIETKSSEKEKEVIKQIKEIRSFYVRHLHESQENELPLIIRVDKQKSTGILHLPESWQIKDVEYNDEKEYCYLKLIKY